MLKLILDYIKVLIWPAVVVITLLSFRSEISVLIARATSVDAVGVSVKFEASSTGQGDESGGNGAPEMWFDLQSTRHTHSDCLRSAISALKDNEFERSGINNGNTAYGYANGYVGAIWCMEGSGNVLFAVAGPGSGAASDRVAGLKDRFMRSVFQVSRSSPNGMPE